MQQSCWNLFWDGGDGRSQPPAEAVAQLWLWVHWFVTGRTQPAHVRPDCVSLEKEEENPLFVLVLTNGGEMWILRHGWFSNIGTAEQGDAAFPSVCWKLAPQELKINLAARLLGGLLLARVAEAGFPSPLDCDGLLAHSHSCAAQLELLSSLDAHCVPPVADTDVSFSAGVQVLWGWEEIHILRVLPFYLIKKYINCAIGSC